MKKHNINSKGEADHIGTRYYLADEVDLQLDALRAMLKRLEWSASDGAAVFCPECQSDKPTHAPSCELDALLKESEAHNATP